jgi:hypothetical protein
MVRDDCARRLDELNRIQPTIVFDGKDGAGGDVSAVTVTVDGRPFTDKLDGTPRQIDPGAHTFTFQVPGQARITRSLVVKEGEKSRIERIVFAPAPTPTAPVIVAASPRPLSGSDSTPVVPESGGGLGTGKVFGLVLGGVGIAGIAVGGVFGAMANTAWSRSKSECTSTNCTPAGHSQAVSDRSTTETDGTIATLGFIGGGVLLVTGTVLFLAAPSPGGSTRDHTARWQVTPVLGMTTAGLGVRGEF